MLVHEKGASLPLSISTVSNCGSSPIARQWQSQQRCCSPHTSALGIYFFTFTTQINREGSWTVILYFWRFSTLPLKKWAGTTRLGARFQKCLEGAEAPNPGLSFLFAHPSVAQGTTKRREKERGGVNGLPGGWLAPGCSRCIKYHSSDSGQEGAADGQGCSLWRCFCRAGNTGEKHSFFQLSPFVCFPIRNYVATAALHFVIMTGKNEFLMRYLCQLQAPCGSPWPRSFVSRPLLNVNQPGGGRDCQSTAPVKNPFLYKSEQTETPWFP